MFKYIIFAVITFSMSFCFAQDVTPLQLKVMQSRKFNKNLEELMDALKTNMEDSGGSCYEMSPTKFDCMFQKGMKGFSAVDLIPIYGMMSRLSDGDKTVSKVSMDIDPRDVKNGITVRMRLYTGRTMDKQVTDTQTYSKKFKEIADTLFTNAIPLEAAVQE